MGEVLLVRDLEREDEPGGRGLEDGRHAGGGARHQQELRVGPGEQPAETGLQRGADPRPQVDRRALVAEGPAEPEGGHAGEDPPGERSQVEPASHLVEAPDVLVRGGRGGRPRDPPQDRLSEHQTHERRRDLYPDRLVAKPLEELVARHPLEARHRQARHDAGQAGKEEDLAPSPAEDRELATAALETGTEALRGNSGRLTPL